MRKAVAWIVLVVLVVSLTACGREKKEEDTRPNGSYGYKKYRYREEKEKEKILLEEYENLVTEAVRNTYDELGVLISTYHAFFDETGEHLLKDISRTIGVTVVTKEYDSLGRCIVEKICGDAESGAENTVKGQTYLENYSEVAGWRVSTNGLPLPIQYQAFCSNSLTGIPSYIAYGLFLGQLMTEPSVKEIRTTYSYRGDTEEITGLRTMSQDTVIAELELGDGGVVLKETVHAVDLQYEEIYDPSENKATFRGNTDEGSFRGVKEYDSEGRCLSINFYGVDYRMEQGDTGDRDTNYRYETTFSYKDDGYIQEEAEYLVNGEGEPERHLLKHKEYAGNGLLVFSENYTEDENGILRVQTQEIYEYAEGGELTKISVRYYWDETDGYAMIYEFEYTENGVISRYYEGSYDAGEYHLDTKKEDRYEYYDDPSKKGKLLHITMTGEEIYAAMRDDYDLLSVNRGSMVAEANAIALQNDYDLPKQDLGVAAAGLDTWFTSFIEEENWVLYSYVISDGGLNVKTIQSKFDDEGRLRELEWQENYDNSTGEAGSVFRNEYDEQGRLHISREEIKSVNATIITEWEYWDKRGK